MKYHQEFRVPHNKKFKLSKHDPDFRISLGKKGAMEELEKNTVWLSEQQYVLYAENQRSLLIVLQGMDTSGKDGVIRHVMKGINPQGCTVSSFKAPSHDEMDHDFLWRIHKEVPAKGDIGIFNRSQYEDVLIARVRNLVPEKVWRRRYEQINLFERTLAENGTTILKFFLHISKDEQKKRLQARLDDPKKNWKFSENDLKERVFWKHYMAAYEEALRECSTEWAPWFVIPSNVKWFRNLAISEIINHTLKKMDLKMPKTKLDIKSIKVE